MKKTVSFLKDLLRYLFQTSSVVTKTSFYSPFIAVKVKEDGTITRILFQNDLYNNFSYQHLLNSNVRTFFTLPRDPVATLSPLAGHEPVERIFHSAGAFPSRNLFEKFEDMFEFHTTIPFSTLFLRQIPGEGIIGIIRLSPVAPRTSNLRSIPLVFLDKQGVIKGANTTLLNYFSPSGTTRSMLEHPAENYMSANPINLLKGESRDYEKDNTEAWQTLCDLDFSGPDIKSMADHISVDDIEKTEQGWVWHASDRNRRLLPLVKPIDFRSSDFRMRIEFNLLSGCLPIVIFNGSRSFKNFFPDFNGYLIGYYPEVGFFKLKQRGDELHETAQAEFFQPGEYTVTVIKRGVRLSYFLNSRLIIGFKDPEPIAHSRGYQHIYCREASELLIKRITVQTLPMRKESGKPFNEVSLLNGTQNAFRFYQVVDAVTALRNHFYYALLLHDISHLKRNIQVLEKKTERTRRELDRYKSMALGTALEAKPFIGTSPAIVRIKENARVAAESTASILIEGETGTGKEVLAQFIHQNSAYREGPFIKVDCAALPETILESELFGYEKGAFTGADQARAGKLEAAGEGTLFLDEIGNLTLTTQAKLLSFLQDFTLVRLGSSKKIKVKTRLVAATNRPLKELVQSGLFRSDLMYRLNTLSFSLPPLRDRPEDIPLLCRQFITVYNKSLRRNVKGFSPDSFKKLLSYHWPGNVRELENIVQKAMLFCRGSIIQPGEIDLPEDIVLPVRDGVPENIPKGDARALKPWHMEALLKKHYYIVKRAAKAIGIARSTFYRKLKEFDISVRSKT